MNKDKLEKTRQEKALDNFTTEMLNSAINGINEAVAMKQKEVDYWKRKAYVLANKYGQCPQHDQGAKDRPFNLNDYLEEIDCLDCPNNGEKKETLYCWKCEVEIKAGHLCEKCATTEDKPPQGIHPEAINTVMESVRKAQEKHVERMKEQETERNENLIDGTFGEFAKSELKKVECVECKEYAELSQCSYDYATNRYTCNSCLKKLAKQAEQEKERKTTEIINQMENKNSKE